MRTALVLLLVAAASSPALAWKVVVDLDADHDPATLSSITTAAMAEVAVHLWPDTPGEEVAQVAFMLDHTCSQCGDFTTIAARVWCELYEIDQDWITHSAFSDPQHNITVCVDCCDETTGWESRHRFSAVADPPLVLLEPVTLARFAAWVEATPPPYCPRVPLRLGIASAGQWQSVTLASEVIPVEPMFWGAIKALYR